MRLIRRFREASAGTPTSISSLQRTLNERALRLARIASPVFTVASLAFYLATGHISFLATAFMTAAIGISSALRLRRGPHDVEFVIAASGIGFLATWGAVPDMVRGTLSAALVLFPMMGVLLLRRAAAVRMSVLFAGILGAQLAWVAAGHAPAGATVAHVIVSLTALGLALGATWILRRTLEASENQAIVEARRFRAMFESAPSAIWEEDWSGAERAIIGIRDRGVTDLRTHFIEHTDEFHDVWSRIRYLDVNPAGLAMVGASSKEEAIANVRPKPPPDPEADAFLEDWVAMANGTPGMTFEATGYTTEGRAVNLHLSWAASVAPDGRPDYSRVIVTMADVTELRTAQRRLDHLVASKDQLVASVSHELRTPLTGVLGIATEVRDNLDSLDPGEVAELLDVVVDQAAEVTQLVEDLMIGARSDLSTLAIHPAEIDVGAEVGLVLSTMARDAHPTVDIPRGLTAWADSLRFRQIMRNLLSNAERYGGPNVRIEGHPDESQTIVRVVDDGPGVPKGDEERIFTPFAQSESGSLRSGSMGLGLTVSRNLANLMDGDLVYRRDDATVFELRLPAIVSAEMRVGSSK